ncbi:hypothetical protein [uncultured Methanobrevibacter sp.]|uniref:hypothetical protein n=1 Tax=uncultured Methanobrevibacter sp. TaxID=253161 RepID=UPI0025CC0014|nr:hypothetical protein [uncultured Methanobrevibacter sp.]
MLKEKNTVRVSCFIDIHFKHILTTKIVETTVNEIKLAIEYLENLKERINITKLFTVYDRGYLPIELMMKTIDLDSKFLIQLPKNIFRH